MLPNGTIEAEHIWKRFRNDRGRQMLRDRIQALRSNTLRRSGWNWALRDIDFKVVPGESVGLIGANGSGKSTLLKILTKIMYPYAGRVETVGRVGALIEVRAGIHSELTGRENIFFYGSILGLSRRDVRARFDQIVDFAELDTAIDRQVKFFSSGMQMRLGFAVAAFLEPHVLLVDEVLAVGDLAFQQKCLDRMREVLASGTTVVFVSHDLPAVAATCRRGIWLSQGSMQIDGPIQTVITRYRRSVEEAAEGTHRPSGAIDLVSTRVSGPNGLTIQAQGPIEIEICLSSDRSKAGRLFLGVSEGPGNLIFSLHKDVHLQKGQTQIRCSIPNLPLPRGRFFLWLGIFRGRRNKDLLDWHPAAAFDVTGPQLAPGPPAIVRLAPVYVDAAWELDGSKSS